MVVLLSWCLIELRWEGESVCDSELSGARETVLSSRSVAMEDWDWQVLALSAR